VIDRLDLEHRNLALAAGIVAGPFAEWALSVGALGRYVAFKHDLGVGGEGGTGDLAAHHLHRPPAQAAHAIELEHALVRLEAAEEKCERIAADHHRHGKRLTTLE